MSVIISRDKSLLYPPFAEQLRYFESRLAAAKLPFHLFMALRTFECQDELYAQGRTLPGKIVTNARGGDSLHNYGLGADFVIDGMPEKPGIQWSWDTRVDFNADGRSDWMQMGEIAESCGLEWGGRWKRLPDLPHVQNTYGLTLSEIKEIYRAGHGIKAVWSKLKAA
jgi:peptidoglycan LD-endopeptidase CwlK